MSTQNEQEQQNSGKVQKNFENQLKKLDTILQGDKSLYKNKVESGMVSSIIEDLFKEESEAKTAEFKTKVRNLIKKHVEFNKFKKQKEQELAKAVEEKMKEFNTEAEACFNMVDGLEKLQQEYASSLKSLSGVQAESNATGPQITETEQETN